MHRGFYIQRDFASVYTAGVFRAPYFTTTAPRSRLNFVTSCVHFTEVLDIIGQKTITAVFSFC